MAISKKEKILLTHLVKIWKAPFISDTHKNKYYSEAENFLYENYTDWVKYIHDSVEFDKLTSN